MINHISLNGILCGYNENDLYRLIKVKRSYKNNKNEFVEDYFLCAMWSRDKKNALFSFKTGSFVSIDGRLENIDDKVVIIVEVITYICGSNIEFDTKSM